MGDILAPSALRVNAVENCAGGLPGVDLLYSGLVQIESFYDAVLEGGPGGKGPPRNR